MWRAPPSSRQQGSHIRRVREPHRMITLVRNGGRFRHFCTASVEKRASLVSNQLNDQLKTLVGSGKLRDARQVFDKMLHRDVYSWTTIIQGYIAATNYDEALLLFSAMHVDDPRVSADSHVLSVALKACGQTSNISFGESLHAFAHKTHLLSDVYVASSLLNLSKGNGMIDESCRLFSELPYRWPSQGRAYVLLRDVEVRRTT